MLGPTSRRGTSKAGEDFCCRCGRSGGDVELALCPVCRRPVCRPCEVRRHGKRFCDIHCAGYFFFGDADDLDDDEDLD